MSSPTPNAQTVTMATIGKLNTNDDLEKGNSLTVHFNPVSLQLQVSNKLEDDKKADKEKGGKPKQFISQTEAKLTMDLIFDTTATGTDVTNGSGELQAFVAPPLPADLDKKNGPPPPRVGFEWGTLIFKGVVESYKETIDFFSANGVPLRSSVNLTLTRHGAVFDPASKGAPKNAGGVDDNLFTAPTGNASDLASAAGAPSAARSLAAANGQESLRFAAGAGLTVGGSIELRPPVAFASAGAGIGLGVDGGIGIGANARAGFSAGAGFGASVGAIAGESASAGVAGLASLSASEGAFAGLRVSSASSSYARIDPSRLVPKIASASVATDAGATFAVGGKASFQGAAGLRAQVGAGARLSFDTD